MALHRRFTTIQSRRRCFFDGVPQQRKQSQAIGMTRMSRNYHNQTILKRSHSSAVAVPCHSNQVLVPGSSSTSTSISTMLIATSSLKTAAPILTPRRHFISTTAAALSQTLSSPSSSSGTTTDADTEAERRHNEVAQGVWKLFPQNEEKLKQDGVYRPPEWFVTLCEDLYFRTSSISKLSKNVKNHKTTKHQQQQQQQQQVAAEGTSSRHIDSLDDLAVKSAASSVEFAQDPSGAAANVADTVDTNATEVDPFLWLHFDLRDEEDYLVEPYRFPEEDIAAKEEDNESQLFFQDPEVRRKLVLGTENKKYVCFCDAYRFPHRSQLPTSVGTESCRLWVDPSNPTPTCYIQLNPHFPPALWLPVKATASAVRRVLGEYATMAASQRDIHHARYASLWDDAVEHLKMQNLPREPHDVLRYIAWMSRTEPFDSHAIKEFHNYQELFLGEHSEPEHILRRLELSPFLFSIPHFRAVTDLGQPEFTPAIDGPGVATSLFRCVFSKALLFVKVHLGTEVKLPPLDGDAMDFLWGDAANGTPGAGGKSVPKLRVPIFVRVVWPDNRRMSGGGPLIARFNELMNTEFANDMPIDALLAVYHVMGWAGSLHDGPLGIRGLRDKLQQLERAALSPTDPTLLPYPGTAEIPCPEYNTKEILAMHLQYLAHLGDPEAPHAIKHFSRSTDASIRMGCAKAALEIGDRGLFREIVSNEPRGRFQRYMTRLVRKRKTRDITDKAPRILDEQYEMAAPLWTSNKQRLAADDEVSRAELERYKERRLL